MLTPFGRYRWKRLPFGLKVSSETIQRKLNDTIFDLPGVFAIADYVIVIGRGVTDHNALCDHDANLHKQHERCREKHIMLSDEKADRRKTELPSWVTLSQKKAYKLILQKSQPYVICPHPPTFVV